MTTAKITAVDKEEERQIIIFQGKLDANNYLDEESKYTGYVIDWDEEEFGTYEFTMEYQRDQNGILIWNDGDETRTVINVFQRRIVPNEQIERNDAGERAYYTVRAVEILSD